MSTLALCKTAGSLAVDSVFDAVLSRLNEVQREDELEFTDVLSGNHASAKEGANYANTNANTNTNTSTLPVSPEAARAVQHAASAAVLDLQGQSQKQMPTVQWALEEHSEAQRTIMTDRKKAENRNATNRYAKTTDSLRRAQELEEQLKLRAAQGAPEGLDEGFDTLQNVRHDYEDEEQEERTK